MSTSPAQLEATFRQILKQRMVGVPVINDKLKVKAIDFQPWKQYQFGILITPWFMNIMLLPTDDSTNGDDFDNKESERHKVGSTLNHVLPSGSYEFVAGYEEQIGHFQSCSLFSPMFEFVDQESAELTAKEALLALMDEENTDTSSQNPAEEIEQIWKGDKPQPAITKNFDGSDIVLNKEAPRKKLSDRLKEPSSRRDFLRGKAFRNDTASTNNKHS